MANLRDLLQYRPPYSGAVCLRGDERLIQGRTTDGSSICRDCVGITTTMTCGGRVTETERLPHQPLHPLRTWDQPKTDPAP